MFEINEKRVVACRKQRAVALEPTTHDLVVLLNMGQTSRSLLFPQW